MKEKENQQDPEEEQLNLDELLNVQGGEEDKGTIHCGLGCYTGGIVPKENTGNDTMPE